jgi:hypothetical protein
MFYKVSNGGTPSFKGLGGGAGFTINCNVGDILLVARATTYDHPTQGTVVTGATQIFSYRSDNSNYACLNVYRATSTRVTFGNATVGVMSVVKLN